MRPESSNNALLLSTGRNGGRQPLLTGSSRRALHWIHTYLVSQTTEWRLTQDGLDLLRQYRDQKVTCAHFHKEVVCKVFIYSEAPVWYRKLGYSGTELRIQNGELVAPSGESLKNLGSNTLLERRTLMGHSLANPTRISWPIIDLMPVPRSWARGVYDKSRKRVVRIK